MVSGQLKGYDDESEDDEPVPDNIDVATDEIYHSISSLFRLTIVVQNIASRDRMERMEKIDMSAYEPFDLSHVREKHPLKKDGEYLLERLGKANTKRRQFLEYNKKHHEKLVGLRSDDMPKTDDPSSRSQAEGDKEYRIGFHEQDYMSEAHSSTMRTTVSTVYEDKNMSFGMTDADDFDSDNRSDTGFSQTSYASSSGSAMGSSSKLRAPPPPNKYDGEPFECPYCFQIVSGIENPTSWQ